MPPDGPALFAAAPRTDWLLIYTLNLQVLTWGAKELATLLNKYAWQPLLKELVLLLTQAQGTIVQTVIGVCGAIPEVGGAVAAAIGTPLNLALGQITSALTSSTVDGFITYARSAEAHLSSLSASLGPCPCTVM